MNPTERSVEWHIHYGLAFNLFTAALYILGSMVVLPMLRTWWCYSFCLVWIAVVAVAVSQWLWGFTHPWSTYSRQLAYLDNLQRANLAQFAYRDS